MDYSYFDKEVFSVSIDCSRNAVMNVVAVKKLALYLHKMGYNRIQLYTEDTYELDNEPLFGYMRGRYTVEELKEINAYCNSLGMEFGLGIQTLAHLNAMFEWPYYDDIRDNSDILLVGEEKTYALIEKMFKVVGECTSTKMIGIGMDEAYFLGYGKYKEIHGEVDRFKMITEHLTRVAEIAQKYDLFIGVSFDMIAKLCTGSADLFNLENVDKIDCSGLPENVIMGYWDYYSTDFDHYMGMYNILKKFGLPIAFNGGIWSWEGFLPEQQYAMDTLAVSMRFCREAGIKNVRVSHFGDDGAECSKFASLPVYYYAIQQYKGNTDLESIKKGFKDLFGFDFDAFISFDKMDHPSKAHEGYANPSKYLIYNDPFTGLNDYRCSSDDNHYYKNLKEEYEKLEVTPDVQHTLDTVIALADLHSVKADIGVRTRKAYKAGDLEELSNIADDYLVVIEKLEKFHETFQKQWMTENKPFGFDIQDIRIGGIIKRFETCRERLLKYIAGEVDKIEELEVELLNEYPGNYWHNYATPNVISHMLYRY